MEAWLHGDQQSLASVASIIHVDDAGEAKLQVDSGKVERVQRASPNLTARHLGLVLPCHRRRHGCAQICSGHTCTREPRENCTHIWASEESR